MWISRRCRTLNVVTKTNMVQDYLETVYLQGWSANSWIHAQISPFRYTPNLSRTCRSTLETKLYRNSQSDPVRTFTISFECSEFMTLYHTRYYYYYTCVYSLCFVVTREENDNQYQEWYTCTYGSFIGRKIYLSYTADIEQPCQFPF